MREICENCKAFMKLTNECRLLAPKSNMVMMQGQLQQITIFPITKAENWCLEFRPKLEN